MSLTFAVEPLAECWHEWLPLARQHWDETEQFHVGQTFGPSFNRYNNYEASGCFVMVIARHDGKLVGYAGFYVVPSMHSQAIISVEDTWFLLPEYRKGWNAPKLFAFAEAEAVKRGAIESSGTVRLTNPHAAAILKRRGYVERASLWVKQLSADSAPNGDCQHDAQDRAVA